MKRTKKFAVAGLLALAVCMPRMAMALGQKEYVQFSKAPDGAAVFPVVEAGGAVAPIYVDEQAWPGVLRAAGDLSTDIAAITGGTPKVVRNAAEMGRMPIIVGTLGKSPVIDQMVAAGKIDVSKIKGKWESYFTQVVSAPMAGVESALVIVGSDKRGTIYGIYDLSEQSGQSPWHYWGDVPAKKHAAIYVKAGKYEVGEPSVKYRGIFFNDEAPALSNYIKAKYGIVKPNNDLQAGPPMPNNVTNYGHEFYTKIFEVMLRAKGNYMWPAMWSNAFNEDDAENARLADEYGIVMGTSHQEAMLRAQKEWDRRFPNVKWNYATDPDRLDAFWREGLTRNKNYESILTMGLRGANDTPMVQGQAAAIDLLNKIIPAQRKIIAETINPDVTKVPQMWCLYKEVQDYYEAPGGGLNAPPDDITLLWAEDNNGSVRRLPTDAERKRSGGAGIYYHFDYHGGPTDYRWINTSPASRIYDQMSMAKQYGADKIWIVNVGKFKNLEVAIDYWLNLGWDSKRWTGDNIMEYHKLWATREFGPQYADEIADLVYLYTKYNGRRKPERLKVDTYSAANYSEAETVAADYNALVKRAEALAARIPPDQRDAYYTLVMYPIVACANLNEMYTNAAMNILYAQQGRASANDYAMKSRANFDRDATLKKEFHAYAGGRWDHFQDDITIGYTTWSEPTQLSFAQVQNRLQQVTPAAEPTLGVAVSGWTGQGDLALAKFNSVSQQKYAIDVFNKGAGSVDYTAKPSHAWIKVSSAGGSVAKDERLWVSIDWAAVPKDATFSGSVTIAAGGKSIDVKVQGVSTSEVTRQTLSGFVEEDGYVSIEPEHYTKKTEAADLKWEHVEGYGRTLSAMRVSGPANFPEVKPGAGTPSLEYRAFFFSSGAANVVTALAPNVAFIPGRDLKYAVSIDEGAPVMVNAIPKNHLATGREWETNAQDEARYASAAVQIPSPGYHTVKIWMVDPGITIQKIVVDVNRSVKASYMGPPESFRNGR